MTEHEELLILRVLAEKYQLELAEKDQTIEAQKTQIEKQNIQIENMIQTISSCPEEIVWVVHGSHKGCGWPVFPVRNSPGAGGETEKDNHSCPYT